MAGERIVPLHVHSQYSLLSSPQTLGSSSPAEYVKQGLGLGHESVALTDSQNVLGLAEYFACCSQLGVRPLPGLEVPVRLSALESPVTTTVLARDTEGLYEIFSLSSEAFSGQREVSVESLVESLRRGGLVVMFQGRIGEVGQYLSQEGFFYGVTDPKEEIAPNIPAVALPEILVASADDLHVYRFLQAIYRPGFSEHGVAEDNGMLTRTLRMSSAWEGMYKLVGATEDIASSVNVGIPIGETSRAVSIPQEMSPEAYLERVIWERYLLYSHEGLREETERELALVRETGHANYFIKIIEVADFAKARGIVYAVEGSAQHSRVLFAAGVTKNDPSGFFAERFISHHRSPDVDFSFPYDQVDTVRQFLRDTYGDVYPMVVVHRMRERTLEKLIEEHELIMNQEQVRALAAAGIPFGLSTHPSGAVLYKNAPRLMIGKGEVAQISVQGAEVLKADTIDTLKRGAVTHINDAHNFARASGIDVKIAYDDPMVISKLMEGWGTGVTNFESPRVSSVAQELGIRTGILSFEDIAYALAAARPAVDTTRYEPFEEGLMTSGVFMFQEDGQIIARDFAGFSPREGEEFRRVMALLPSERVRHPLFSKFITNIMASSLSLREKNKVTREAYAYRGGYAFLKGHSFELARMVYEQAYLWEKYPLFYSAALLKQLSEKASGLIYPVQVYINEMYRHGVKLYFPRGWMDELPCIVDGRLYVGKGIFRKGTFIASYARFLEMRRAGLDTYDFEKRQFGFVLTQDTSERIPEVLHWRAGKKQVAGELVGWSPTSEGGNIHITLDSGRLVHLLSSRQLVKGQGEHLLDRKGYPVTGRIWNVGLFTPEMAPWIHTVTRIYDE